MSSLSSFLPPNLHCRLALCSPPGPQGSPAQSSCCRLIHCLLSPSVCASFPPEHIRGREAPSLSWPGFFLPQPGHPGGGWSPGLERDADCEKPGRGLLQNSGHLLLPLRLVLPEGVRRPGSQTLLRLRLTLLVLRPRLPADFTNSASLAFQNQRSHRSWRLACESDVSTEGSGTLKSTTCSINHPIFPDNSEVRLLAPPPFFSFVFF